MDDRFRSSFLEDQDLVYIRRPHVSFERPSLVAVQTEFVMQTSDPIDLNKVSFLMFLGLANESLGSRLRSFFGVEIKPGNHVCM